MSPGEPTKKFINIYVASSIVHGGMLAYLENISRLTRIYGQFIGSISSGFRGARNVVAPHLPSQDIQKMDVLL